MATFAEQAFRQHLVDSTAVSAIIGTRLFNWAASESAALPYGAFVRVDAEHVGSMNGGSDYVKPRIQVDWYSRSLSEVMDLADKARLRMDGYAGTVSVNSTSLDIKSLLVSEQHLHSFPDKAGDEPVYRVSQDYIVAHAEAAAN